MSDLELSSSVTTPSSTPSPSSSPSPSLTPPSLKTIKYLPPWTDPYIIGIAGTSGSGKTSVASKIVSSMNQPWTVLISMDNFYHPLTPEQRNEALSNNFDFDKPESIDMDAVYQVLKNLKSGKRTKIPVYSFNLHNRIPNEFINIYGARVIVFEGIYALYDPKITAMMDLKIYVDADLDICLARRLSRDIINRGRDIDGCIQQWNRFVKPNADKFIKPTMRNADVVIPSVSDNSVAVQLLISHIKTKLIEKSQEHVKYLKNLTVNYSEKITLDAVQVLPQTNQINCMLDILLDKYTCRDDFVFYFDRLSSLLLNKALDNMPNIIQYKNIETSTGIKIENSCYLNYEKVCAVQIIRSGDCFVKSLKRTIPYIPMGKLLIQSDSTTGEPQLHFDSLPRDISTNYDAIILLDAQIISGAELIMAIQVLYDNNVQLTKIKVVVMIATEIGLRRIINAFGSELQIIVGKLVKHEDLETNPWARIRFLDSKYFGT
ncbi:uridine kinase URK1 SCDLUD_001204 [Saccharomycodes ludwigii]|uniref:uridine kinase URK1 n=1 Tax=Saccharomycodes ludwigii TaxID=36035 RepID=UPI001E8787D2|nr:hypothetical protein SCDLUD_001204 [Saccharomycodes ludwigii]KAH3903562.1 hypothetical protein SCDLUD_001204 [Saccharomycodes ludwigii]